MINRIGILGMFTAVAVMAPASAYAASNSVQLGSVAVASYEQVSDDGCVVIRGELAVADAILPGENPEGVYVTATRQDTCDPNDNGRGYAGYLATGNFWVLGTSLGHFAGTVIAEEYSGQGAAPLTFELDLFWHGFGKVTTTHQTSNEGGVLSAVLQSTRAAHTSGTFAIDGDAATVTSASLGSQTSVSVSHP
jgi:hypothetical protein